MQNRIEKLFKKLNLESNTGIFISNESNVSYMSGFSGEASYLILTRNGNVLMTDGRYDEQAEDECGDRFEVTKWFNPKRPDPETILHYVNKFQINKLLFNDRDLSVSIHNTITKACENLKVNLELIPLSGVIEDLRAVKDDNEIDLIRKACEIADEALKKTVPKIKEGVTELAVVAELEYQLKMSGAENISFDTIVLSGKKTSLPHGKPSQKKLEKGDFLQIDFGALYKGYHSDMSRTFIIGQASEEQKTLYETMLKATLESTDVVKPGVSAKYPDDVVRQVLTEEYLEDYYPGLGHGVGLDVHELPNLGSTAKAELQVGNVITIEPGVYIKGWGGMRIEDTILVTKDGYEVLSKYPRNLQVL